MSQAFNQCSLYLCPAQHDFTLGNIESFIAELKSIQLITKAINKQNNTYYIGENYLDYIAYMGCAPNIQFEADPNSSDNDETFCQINIHQYGTAQLIVSQHQTVTPLCPHCKKPVKDWKDNKTASSIQCTLCSNTTNIDNFNWRKMAGFAQLFIEVTDIFPKEAIPQQLLLGKLADIAGIEWLYFYTCK